MLKSIETIRGDSQGLAYQFPVLRFDGSDPAAPSAYLQAALHADELPGTAAIDALMPKLRAAEAEGRIRGRITVVPVANPIGAAQYLYGDHQGRYHTGTRVNFNRDFPLLPAADTAGLPDDAALLPADARLKARLVALSMGHDLVLDLHCDDEGLDYLYIHAALWPQMADLATDLGAQAVLLWEGSSDAAFEEAALHPYLQMPKDAAGLDRRAVTTVEFRGRADVAPGLAAAAGEGLYRFLVHRGVVADAAVAAPAPWSGVAVPLDNVEMLRAPVAGPVLYHVAPGDRVAAGDRLVTILHAPGEEGGRTDLFAPQDGLILTRRTVRTIRPGEDLLKLLGGRASADARPGALED